jgi:hypothetical protein
MSHANYIKFHNNKAVNNTTAVPVPRKYICRDEYNMLYGFEFNIIVNTTV